MQIREIEIEISKNAQNKRKKFVKMYKITIYSCKFAHLVVVQSYKLRKDATVGRKMWKGE